MQGNPCGSRMPIGLLKFTFGLVTCTVSSGASPLKTTGNEVMTETSVRQLALPNRARSSSARANSFG
jgi:hypothetical protein